MSTTDPGLRCPTCGAVATPGSAWCGLCFAALPVAPAVAATAPMPDGFRPGAAAAPRTALVTQSRWKSGDTTFGPIGRVLVTIGMFLPYPLFFMAFPFGLAGVAAWTAIMPMALRQIWAPSKRVHLPPE